VETVAALPSVYALLTTEDPSWIPARQDELSNVGLQASRHAGADVCLPRQRIV